MAHDHHTTFASESERDRTTTAPASDDVGPQLRQLYQDLLAIIERDPEQEIIGVALPVVDWVMSTARDELSSRRSPLAAAMVDVISPDTCDGGIPVRVLDAWLVVGQLLAALDSSRPITPETPAAGAGR